MEPLLQLVRASNWPALIHQLEYLEARHIEHTAIHSHLSSLPASSRPSAPAHGQRATTHAFPLPFLPPVSPHLVLALQLVACCAADDIDSARFAAKRATPQVAAHSLVAAVEPLWTALWVRDYARFWRAVEASPFAHPGSAAAATGAAGSSGAAQTNANPEIALVGEAVAKLVSHVRGRVRAQLAKAFLAIRVGEAAAVLGVSPEEAAMVLGADGWTVEEGFLVAPPEGGKGKVEERQRAGKAVSPLEVQMQRDAILAKLKSLSDMVLGLEL